MLVNILLLKAAGTQGQEESGWSLGCGGGYWSSQGELPGTSENWGHVLSAPPVCPHSILRACNWIWQVVCVEGGWGVSIYLTPGPHLLIMEAAISSQMGGIKPVVIFYVMMLTLLWNYTLRMPQSRLIHINSHLSDAAHNLLVAMTHPVIFP